MKTKKLLFALCFAVTAVGWQTAPNLFAQQADIPPVPAPTPPGTPVAEYGPAVQMIMDDGTGLTLQIRGKRGPRVLLRPGHKTTAVLQYNPGYAGLTVDATALDGGDITFAGNRNLVGAGGTVVLQFSNAREPGLYRIMLNCGGIISTLRFWVPDPAQPGGDPSIIVPQPLPSATPAPAQ